MMKIIPLSSSVLATCRSSIRRHLSSNFKFLNASSAPMSNSYSPPRAYGTRAENFKNGPGLREFLVAGKNLPPMSLNVNNENTESVPYLSKNNFNGNGRKVFFEIYGCQMNTNDGEVVYSLLKTNGYIKVDSIADADVVLLLTCSIRDGAEIKIWNRLKHLASLKKKRSQKDIFQIGILGCMAERLKTELLEKEQLVDVVAGPDSYKDLPRLLALTQNGQSAVNVLLSLEETYADVIPVRLNEGAVTAFVTIMRGCDNMCSYCIVPFTRGRERSRPMSSIETEVQLLAEQGIKEITLLGQNVNSYCDYTTDPNRIKQSHIVPGFKTVYKPKVGGARFAELLETIARAVPNTRIRFTSPHPKDFPTEVLRVIKNYPNICKSIHLPAQSGNDNVLDRMRRGYTREAYLDLVSEIRAMLPNVALSSDFICGFCGETDEEFEDTLTLIEKVKYNVAYLFAYSMREKTTAHRRYKDDVSDEVKNIRLRAMIAAFRQGATEINATFKGKSQLILVEGISKRSDKEWFGRNDANIKVIIPSLDISTSLGNNSDKKSIKAGDLVMVHITDTNSQVLKGQPLYHCEQLV